jgi:hypothetical protein
MENRVGDNVPTPAKLAALLKQLQDVVAEIKKFGVILTKDERRRLLRVRRDSEAMQRLIYAIAQKRGLKIEGFPLAGMLADINLAQAMEPFEQAMTVGQQLTSDTPAAGRHRGLAGVPGLLRRPHRHGQPRCRARQRASASHRVHEGRSPQARAGADPGVADRP